jgi:ferredoxin
MPYRITDDCLNCGACIDECPEGAIIAGDDKSRIDQDKCTECSVCIEKFFCPAVAIIKE